MAKTSDVTERVAATVTTEMDRVGASINGLADATGIPFSTLRRKLAGHGDFTLGDLLAIAETLGVTPADLLPEPFRAARVA